MTRDDTSKLNPITLEVLRSALPAISDEMSYDLQRTSYNMMIYEVRDFCTALVDIDGALISQNVGGVSHFVADLGVVIRDGVARYGLDGFAPGDVILHNHQATAGQHLNNMVLYTPVYYEGALFAFAVVRAHWVDVGGLSTGFGGAGAFDPWSEGLQFNQVKIYDGGTPDEKLIGFVRDNIRYPDSSMGDMRSQLAACRLAERRLTELLDRYGRGTVRQAIDTIYAQTEAKCRAVVAAIPDGVYEAESLVDARGGQPPYEIRVKVTISGSDLEIDLSGCSQQREGGANSRTFAGAYIAYKALTAPLEALNEGAFAALKAVIPEGNMMMARYPALMTGWAAVIPTVVDTVWRALADVLPDRVPAGHSGTLGASVSFSGIDPRKGNRFVAMSLEAGGWGGRPDRDGADASMSVCQGDVRNSPIETMELKTPIQVIARRLRPDSGGAGKYRGGLGVETHFKGLVDGRWGMGGSAGRKTCPPWGLRGGEAGEPASVALKAPGEEQFHPPAAARVQTPAGTEVVYRTAGGGGWGEPHQRDEQAVLRDVVEGWVSVAAAAEKYGVAVAADRKSIDRRETDRLRGVLIDEAAA